MTMVGLEGVAAGFALLAPVYALLFQIQRNIGRLSAKFSSLSYRVENNEDDIAELQT